jgi:ABC-2 type transport system permease protein
VDRILAIVGLRLRLIARRSRGGAGVLNLAGAVLVMLSLGLLGIALAVGFGALTHIVIGRGDEQGIRTVFLVVFYTAFFFGVVMPLLTGIINPGFDPSSLRIFPISRFRLYALTLAASFGNAEHWVYYPAFAVICFTGVLLRGINPLAGLATVGLAVLFCVGWGNTVVLFLVSLMRKRRAREILGIVLFAVIVAASLTPVLLEDAEGEIDSDAAPYLTLLLRVVVALGAWLPPTLAAEALTDLHTSGTLAALPSLFWLLVWDVAGVALGYRVFARYHLGDRERTPTAKRTARPPRAAGPARRLLSADSQALAFVPREVRAVAAKEIRYLFRSVIGKFNLLMLPVLVIVVAIAVGRGFDVSLPGLDGDTLAFFGLLMYVTLFSNNFVNNAFAWEADGVQAYFISPVALHRVLAGKNLAVWTYNGLLLLITIVTWSVFRRIPSLATLLTAIGVYAACVLFFTTVGNFVSVLFPVGRDISSIRNTPSQIALLISLASLAVAASLAATFLLLPAVLGFASLRPVSVSVLLGLLAWLYTVGLRLAGRLMDRRREKLIDGLRVVA